MCGICGIISQKENIDRARFEKMTDMVTHRGPDDGGLYYGNNLALGHRRLSVIDLSRTGHQPFCYKNRYIMVYNGEIYNYLELRDKLVKIGYKFETETDTEVLIASYDLYKEKCVEQFNGMWAFAIYDKIENTVFCSRDRFGIKPFYYAVQDGMFLFASEIKQILSMKSEVPQANRKRLLEFIVLGDLDFTDETMFQEIKQLKGGHNLLITIDNLDYEITQYYYLEKVARVKKSFDESSIIFREKFQNAVKYRLRADVPLGYCLSGGLDSSAIVCMADSLLKDLESEQVAVSSCFEDKRYDEREYIEEVIKKTNIDSCKIFPQKEDLFEKLDKIIWHMDEPFGSTSVFAQWNVFEAAAKRGLTVMLDGQGADEQLAGYTGFYSVIFADYIRSFRWLSLIKEVSCYKKMRANSEKYVSSFDIIANAIVSAWLPDRIKLVLKKKLSYKNKNIPFSKEIIDEVLNNRFLYPVNNARGYILDSMLCSMASLLHYEDRNSMAHSIESRVPFLDFQLVEAIFSMPINYKIKSGVTKAVMRDGLKDILPEKIRNRYSKLGFVTPEDQWIASNQTLFRNELDTACDVLNRLFDKDMVMQWFDDQDGSVERGNYLVWRIICASHWVKVFNVKIG